MLRAHAGSLVCGAPFNTKYKEGLFPGKLHDLHRFMLNFCSLSEVICKLFHKVRVGFYLTHLFANFLVIRKKTGEKVNKFCS